MTNPIGSTTFKKEVRKQARLTIQASAAHTVWCQVHHRVEAFINRRLEGILYSQQGAHWISVRQTVEAGGAGQRYQQL